MMSFRDALEASVREAQAHARLSNDAACAFELELRIGLVRTTSGRRTFVSNVNDKLFFATYAALSSSASSCTPKQTSRHAVYASGVREEVANATTRWTEKTPLRAAEYERPVAGTWFDVRVAFSRERRVAEPDAVREARTIAARVRSPLDNERTRAGMPVHSRARERRTLRFAEAGAWQLEWTIANATFVCEQDVGFGALQHTLASARENTHEIELEYVGGPDYAPGAAVDEALWLLERLSNALGTTAAERRRRLTDDRLRYERGHI